MNKNNDSDNSFIKKIDSTTWNQPVEQLEWVAHLEAGRVLHFLNLPFEIKADELSLFATDTLDPKFRNISLGENLSLKGMQGTPENQEIMKNLILKFRELANQLVISAFPVYSQHLRLAPTSFRPKEVQTRIQSVRADDKRLHVDAFPTRPNSGERILRVFLNVNPNNSPRVWRIGEPFEEIAKQFLPKIKKYSWWQAKALQLIGVTKSLRSEYDHLMLGMHDAMKRSDTYQRSSSQITYEFAPGSVWVCYSDQTAHAVMSGQYMMEQTYHLPVKCMYDEKSSPLAILQRLTNKKLVN